jgi:hypothetical protein
MGVTTARQGAGVWGWMREGGGHPNPGIDGLWSTARNVSGLATKQLQRLTKWASRVQHWVVFSQAQPLILCTGVQLCSDSDSLA